MAGKQGAVRRDNWTDAENLLLVNTILEQIKIGNTLHESMAIASERLETRTYDACQHHWSKNLRKNYIGAYNAARAEALLKKGE